MIFSCLRRVVGKRHGTGIKHGSEDQGFDSTQTSRCFPVSEAHHYCQSTARGKGASDPSKPEPDALRAGVRSGEIQSRTHERDDAQSRNPIAEGWFYDIQNRIRAGEQLHEPKFSDVVSDFLTDPTVKASVSAGQHENYGKKWSVLERFFADDIRVSQVTLERLEEIRNIRAAGTNRYGEPITANTIDKDMTFIRQVLRWGQERKSLKIIVPPAPKRRGRFGVVKRGRPTLSLKQWRRITRKALADARATEQRREQQERDRPRGRKVDFEKAWELYYFILIACGGALRTGEAYSLRWMDCSEPYSPLPRDPTKTQSTSRFWENIRAENGRMVGC